MKSLKNSSNYNLKIDDTSKEWARDVSSKSHDPKIAPRTRINHCTLGKVADLKTISTEAYKNKALIQELNPEDSHSSKVIEKKTVLNAPAVYKHRKETQIQTAQAG